MFDVNAIMKARDSIVNYQQMMTAFASSKKLQTAWNEKISEAIQYFAQKNNLSLYDLTIHLKKEVHEPNLNEVMLATIFTYKDKKIFFAKMTNDQNGIIIEIQPCDNYNI